MQEQNILKIKEDRGTVHITSSHCEEVLLPWKYMTSLTDIGHVLIDNQP